MKTLFGYNSLMMMMMIVVNFGIALSSPPPPQFNDSKLTMNSRIDVFVINEMSKLPILVRCQSKNDDLGYHILDTGEQFQWHCKNSVLDNTLFFCHFYMEDASSKKWDNVFDVLTDDIMDNGCSHYLARYHYTCYWLVRDDGFYLGGNLNERGNFVKMHGW